MPQKSCLETMLTKPVVKWIWKALKVINVSVLKIGGKNCQINSASCFESILNATLDKGIPEGSC